MAAIDVVNRVLREFKRYTGDGLPNEPVGAPLPVGDPASGAHNPKKAELREALLAQLTELDDQVQQARDWASEDKDVIVADGEYSAKHYSAKAADSASEAANQVAGVIPSLQRFAVGGAVQSVNLGNPELVGPAVRVFIDGVYQFSDTWSISAGVITPVGGTWPGDGVTENMEVVIDATSAIGFGVPSNGSVSADKIIDGAVEREKIADGAVGEDELDPALLTDIQNGPGMRTDTPFGQMGMRMLLGEKDDAHYGFNSGIFPITDDHWVIVYRKASHHTVVNGSEIRAVDTFDRGATLENDRKIYTYAAADTRNFVTRVMANGRLGIIASRREEAPSLAYIDPVFIYSDDDGATWSSQIVTANTPGQGVNFHGNWIDYPASVGGDDDQGFIAYSYGSVEGSVAALVTTDNGTTWSWVMDVATSALTITEVSCSRLGVQDKWILFARPAGAIGDPGRAWVSTDPLSFGTDNSAGVEMARNPPLTIYDDDTGLFWYMGFARRDRGLGKTTGSAGAEDVLLMVSADANALYAAGGDMSALGKDWSVVASIPDWASGYMFPRKIAGKWYATFVCGEEYPGHSYSRLCMVGDFVPSNRDVVNFANLFARNPVGDDATFRNSITVGFEGVAPTADAFVNVAVASDRSGIRTEVFSTSTRTHVSINNANGEVGSISAAGSASSFNTSSDGRLKPVNSRVPIEEEIDIDAVWAAIAPLAYSMLSGKDLSKIEGRWFGLIAQDLYEVFPQAVTPGKGEPGQSGFRPWGIDYSKIVPLILARQKQFERRTNERLAALEGGA